MAGWTYLQPHCFKQGSHVIHVNLFRQLWCHGESKAMKHHTEGHSLSENLHDMWQYRLNSRSEPGNEARDSSLHSRPEPGNEASGNVCLHVAQLTTAKSWHTLCSTKCSAPLQMTPGLTHQSILPPTTSMSKASLHSCNWGLAWEKTKQLWSKSPIRSCSWNCCSPSLVAVMHNLYVCLVPLLHPLQGSIESQRRAKFALVLHM